MFFKRLLKEQKREQCAIMVRLNSKQYPCLCPCLCFTLLVQNTKSYYAVDSNAPTFRDVSNFVF